MRQDLHSYTTKELLEELVERQGVTYVEAAKDEPVKVDSEGPVTVLIVKEALLSQTSNKKQDLQPDTML